MNKPLRRVALAMMAMIVLLLANVTYVQVIRADELRSDSRNSRMLYREYSTPRGQITAGGKLLAESVATDDKLKYLRTYPNGPLYAPVTGYYSFVYGSSGVESAKNEVLNGTADSLALTRLSDLVMGREQQGGNVELTIDPAMQQAAHQQLTSKGLRGSVVALNPQNGAILAMANSPSYDPNRLAGHRREQQKQAWQELTNAEHDPMLNRAILQTYPPGSTFKLITAAAALETGKFDANTQVTAKSSITLPKTTDAQLPNYGNSTCGTLPTAPLWEAMARSCNTAFAEVAGAVGEQKLRETAQSFGFGKDLYIPMEVANSDLGKIPGPAALYQSGIGQRDVRVTPMQNAMMAAAIANDGTLMKPHLVEKTLAPDMSVLDKHDPQRMSRPISPDIAHTLREMMVKSEQYSGDTGKITGVQIASKTGTAQHGANTDPHGWYVAFAPAENPRIAVAVIVEDGGNMGADATGGKIAGPIGRAVIRAGLQGGG
ncbi:cell elongation-specific peptidoglycan D,D-transpeptidase [Halopolyspora algeriensis]|uniref:Cell elongation-specific peptidoglycan D,D-transpeptidase n=1 Tax=Halopolyspora algeriensis TaxID=1500506 RepID=A0A368VYH2_9ACTN|nr:penicillin-binding protein 2 [Halopolyspora algeriensis]RCW47256.1 cell elongation-specific peptidoglycan D,D-transpeptidase [Halopolyspora algeriensis]TQM42492.1 cell elongation-specific peptidoglycan D,D-transpeptidase [Halopolyspora algeriensis]